MDNEKSGQLHLGRKIESVCRGVCERTFIFSSLSSNNSILIDGNDILDLSLTYNIKRALFLSLEGQ